MEVIVYGCVGLSAVLVVAVAIHLRKRRRADVAQKIKIQLKKSADTIRDQFK